MDITKKRYWELDAIRGTMIILMVIYHLFFDLIFFGNFSFINIYSPIWIFLAKIGASIFLLVVGISATISYQNKKTNLSQLISKFLKRGLLIFSFGILITIATYFLIPENFIIFGILHLIGASIMLAPLFLKLKK